MTPAPSPAAPMEEGGWLAPLAGSLAEALPRLYGEPLDPLVREVILALAAGLGQGLLELPLRGPAPEGITAAVWPEGHRQALGRSRLSREPDGPLMLSDAAVAWRRWRDQRDRLLAELLARAERPPAWAGQDALPGMDMAPGFGVASALAPAAESTAPAANAAAASTVPQPGGMAPGGPSRRARRQAEGPSSGQLSLLPEAGAAAPQAQPSAPTLAIADGLPPFDPQQLQAVAALGRHGLVLLEGGPGTGKTSTVRGLLAALRRHHPQARVQLAAPPGKAAARLRGACGGQEPCTTLHRLLESRGDQFGRNRRNPLELDLLVVDEMSMVDQGLMAALLEALPASCQLVLVGDAAQLPPIAPGAVLRELQHAAVRQRLGSAAVTLTRVHRNAGSIAAVAARLREGLEGEVPPLALVRPLLERLGPDDNLNWQEADSAAPPAAALAAARRQQQRLATLARRWQEAHEQDRATWQQQLLQERERLLLLTPRRRGRWGVEGLHQQLLGELAQRPAEQWPSGTPVLCCRNLPELGLANGDLGVLVGPEQAPPQRRLLFEAAGTAGEIRLLHPALLAGAVEPALALTVHKAQGSEAEAVIVLLAAADAIDGRLLYTALTRARRRALLITGRERFADPAIASGCGGD
ncbi:MAG: ATP-dependent RecD-like DNA helicase [Synechococcaceae cyanobacterium]